MTVVRIEAIKPKRDLLDPQRYLKAIENAGNETAKAVEVDFNVTTRTWSHKPAFKITHTPNSGEWKIATDDKIYGYVSEGTKRHPITAKNVPFLAYFKTGFRPKSRPGFIGSNVGAQAKKDFRGPKTVMHPGTKARKFAEAIKAKWDAEWPRQLARAIRAAVTYG